MPLQYPTCLLLSLALIALLVCGCVNGDAECIPKQRSLLLDLKHGFVLPPPDVLYMRYGFVPPNGSLLDSWKPGSNCCNWTGITCDPISGNVIGLHLGGQDISGSIDSDALFGLTSLQSLDLSENAFENISIPQPGFEKLKQLKRLDLSFAGFAGQIPIGISHLTSLEYLDLSYGDLRLENPDLRTLMRNLSNLLVLKLSGVDLNLDVKWISTLLLTSAPQLQVLSMFYSNISGSLNKDFFQLKMLEELDLSENNVSGVLPDFPKGCALQILNLESNKISGGIPYSIGKLVNLTYLDLAENSLTGPIPGSLFALPLLRYLDLSYNQLSGELDASLNTSISLKTIDLQNNQLCGQIPPSIFYLPSLRSLYLESNNFNEIELDINMTMRNLSFLSLSHNKFSLGELNDFYFHSFPNLKSLELAGLGLSKIPTFLKNLDAIAHLDLSNNKIGGDIPRWIFNNLKDQAHLNLSYNLFSNIENSNDISMSNFSTIDLRSNMLQGSIPLPPPSILFIDISNNNFSGIVPPEFFSNLKGANYVSVANNTITGEIPPSICEAGTRPLDSSSPLEILDLSHNLFIGPIPSCLLENTSLLVLNLGGNQLTGTIPQNIKEGCQLKSIILSDNRLEGPLPQSLVNCSRLQILDLANNHIVDSFPFWLGDHVGLQVLSLKSNRFNGPLIPSKSQEKKCFSSELRILDLSSNHFHGNLSLICFSGRSVMRGNNSLPPLPSLNAYSDKSSFYENTIAVIKGQEFQLKMILNIFYNVVDFSNNSLEGGIPRVIGELLRLNVLSLSHNSLTGKIPSELGDLTQLESLDLSANNLSGEIPQHLTSFTSLGLLNLSSNNLTGSIPQGGQFSARSNNSFQDNPGLCGIPLSKQCDDEKQGSPTAMPPATTSDHSSSSLTYVIGLALSIGIGFGVGLSVVLVLQNVSIEFSKMVGRC